MVGYLEWNLVLSIAGGPNHVRNFCDASVIADPSNALGTGPVIVQASYYYIGHFSRFVPRGSRRIALQNTVAGRSGSLSAADVQNGQPLAFAACGELQWQWRVGGSLVLRGTTEAEQPDGDGECVSIAQQPPALQMWACDARSQPWTVRHLPSPLSGSQLVSLATGKCLTAVSASGAAVGLDPGVRATVAQLLDCEADGAPGQTFFLRHAHPDGLAARPFFSIRTQDDLCMQPFTTQARPRFDAVAFLLPSGSVSLVVMNTGRAPVQAFDPALPCACQPWLRPDLGRRPHSSPSSIACLAWGSTGPWRRRLVVSLRSNGTRPRPRPPHCSLTVW